MFLSPKKWISRATKGIDDAAGFPWPTAPPERNVYAAMWRLASLGALSRSGASPTSAANDLRITTLGRRLVLLPIPPRYGVALYAALEEAVDLVSARKLSLSAFSALLRCACALVAGFSVGNLFSFARAEESGSGAAGKKKVAEDGAAEGAEDAAEEGAEEGAEEDDDNVSAEDDVNDDRRARGKRKAAKKAADRATDANADRSHGGTRGAGDASKQRPCWFDLDDDVDSVSFAMSGYAAARIVDEQREKAAGKKGSARSASPQGGESFAEAFCGKQWLNSKQMEEAFNLMQQLAKILATKLNLPSAVQLAYPIQPPVLFCAGGSSSSSGDNSGSQGVFPAIRRALLQSCGSENFAASRTETLGAPAAKRRKIDSSKDGKVSKQPGFFIDAKADRRVAEQLLKRSVVAGLVDHLATQATDDRGAYVCCAGAAAGTTALSGTDTAAACSDGSNVQTLRARLHMSSNVFRTRPRPALLAFDEVTAAPDKRAEGEMRNFLRGCVPVEEGLLSRLYLRTAEGERVGGSEETAYAPKIAATASTLFSFAAVLPSPAPRYVPKADQVSCFVAPVFRPLALTLPSVEVDGRSLEQWSARDVSSSATSSSASAGAVNTSASFLAALSYRVFARALLEGLVYAKLRAFAQHLSTKPATFLFGAAQQKLGAAGASSMAGVSSAALQSSKCYRVVSALQAAKVASRRELEAARKSDPDFLIAELLAWFPARVHTSLRAAWRALA